LPRCATIPRGDSRSVRPRQARVMFDPDTLAVAYCRLVAAA
jgi:hypothetical protein